MTLTDRRPPPALARAGSGKIAATILPLFLASGCAGDSQDPTAFDISLIPDLNLNSESQILDQIDSVRVIVDSEDGLYPADAARVDGDLMIANFDADDHLELAVVASLPPTGLPTIRLARGGLPDVAIDVRVEGLSTSGESVAAGGVWADRFTDDVIVPLPIPFNLKPEQLPPRVIETYPEADQSLMACDVGAIIAVFSKEVSRESLIGSEHFYLVDEGTEQLFAEASDETLDVMGSVARLELLKPIAEEAAYRIVISDQVTDRDGRPLDQVPADADSGPYTASFTTTRCGSGPVQLWCWQGDTGKCPGEDRFECVAGECVPASCAQVDCSDGFVCDDATSTCAVDCRQYGDAPGTGLSCPSDRSICDPNTGLCVAE